MGKTSSDNLSGRYNRDDDLKAPAKAGRAPRPASEPEGAEGSTRTARTRTNPATGEPASGSSGR